LIDSLQIIQNVETILKKTVIGHELQSMTHIYRNGENLIF